MSNDNDDPRDFSLYGGPMREYGERSRRSLGAQMHAALLNGSRPCQTVKTKTGRPFKTPATVMLSAFDLDVLQRALSGYLRETMEKPRHLQSKLEDHLESLMARLKAMEGE